MTKKGNAVHVLVILTGYTTDTETRHSLAKKAKFQLSHHML